MPNFPLGLGGAPAGVAGPVGGLSVIADGSYTHLLGQASQVVVVTGMLATDRVRLTINQNDATMFGAQAVPAAGQFTVFAQVAPTANCKVAYEVTR